MTTFSDSLTENFLRQDDSSFKDDVPKRLVESDVYDLYKKWCDDEGIAKPTVKTNFRDAVEKFSGEKRVRTREGGMGADAARSFAYPEVDPDRGFRVIKRRLRTFRSYSTK